jgi:hypothetical protein
VLTRRILQLPQLLLLLVLAMVVLLLLSCPLVDETQHATRVISSLLL